MGITPMGDIISILRHSKTVTDQTARDEIMAENQAMKIVAKINPAPAVSSGKPLCLFVVIESYHRTRLSASIKPRRVLPEHEGKYKIVLPSGTTKKSKEILAKHSAMQSDKMEKKSIFDRLNSKDVEMADSTSGETVVRVSKASSSSIFNRLGNYKELEKKIEKNSIAFSGILKNSPTQMVKSLITFEVRF